MNAGTLELAARELSNVLEPLADALGGTRASDLLASLGLRFPDAVLAQASIAGPLNAARSAAAALPARRTALESSLAGGNPVSVIQAGATLLQAITSLLNALSALGNALAALPPASVPGIDAPTLANFSTNLSRHLLAHTLIGYMQTRVPTFSGVLALTGVLDNLPSPGDPANPAKPGHMVRDLHLDRLPDFLTNPLGLMRNLTGWGNPAFNQQVLLNRLAAFLGSLGLVAKVDSPAAGQFVLQSFFVDVVPDTSINPNGLVARMHVGFDNGTTSTFNLSPEWTVKVVAKGTFSSETELKIAPPPTVTFTPPVPGFNGSVTTTLTRSGSPFVLLGTAGDSRLEVAGCSIGAGIAFSARGATSEAQPRIEVRLENGKAIIDTSKGDSFLSILTGGVRGEAAFALAADWTPAAGLRFSGSSGLEISLPMHAAFGPAKFETLYLRAGVDSGSIPIEISAALAATLGPLDVSVDRIGVIARASFPAAGGNVGPLNLEFKFKPPTGAGLSLDAGGFKGGGFLTFDNEKGEYAGALELDFKGLFTVKAIGIINTKMPDGSKGFSLLIVIAAEFTPIQLSFGFTLNGVGGIFGLNRMIVVAALAEGVRTNAVKSILFPENVVANISRIISDIKQFFPPQQDHFVVGPMAKLGWGTPSIITAELGLLLDLPNPMFAIVGVLKAVLPAEEAPILRLQVNFIGILDFERGYMFFRADLFDSRLLIYSITGTMALLVSWGEAQTFALSVGGFHPDFRDLPTIPALPDGFRGMARIGISLLSDDNPRLKVESYFAVTSNTVQFGARVELYAGAAGFNVYGFLGYDVLFQFDPFRFIAHLYGGIALREGSSVIAGINISAQLSGPTPWDARGEASLTILFFEISVDFHVTWGDPPPAITSNTEDLLKVLQREFNDTRNWRAELPSNNHLHVSLRKINPPVGAELLVIHPAGVLTFSERSLPLEDYSIQKFGNKKPLSENKFKLSNASSNGMPIPADYQSVRELFAPGNFTELSDSDKLSRRSFEKLPSGFKLTGTSDLRTTLPVVRPVDYELSYLRRERLEPAGRIKLVTPAYNRLVKGSAVRQSTLSNQQNRISLNAPPPVELPEETFAIVNAADLTAHAKTATGAVFFATQAEAYQQQHELINQNPALAGQIQVVSHFELNPN
ncbi:MAG TPA: DUF6603 domain-containing protein [Terriglobia bacterium]|nr:DUF6603 domain-containing protein [Terriglobia bacterium]